MNQPRSQARTDLPTMVLHWGMVLMLLLSVSTGWRIASLTDSSVLLLWLDALLLQGNVMRWHFYSAAMLVAVVTAYLVFLWRAGVGGRLAVHWPSLRNPDRRTRWQALNKLMYWMALLLLAGAAFTGVQLYFLPGLLPSAPLVVIHRGLSWLFVVYVALHVLGQIMLGGVRQVLKIVSPRLGYGLGAAVALTAGLAGAAVSYMADVRGPNKLMVGRADEAPLLDGADTDAVWQSSDAVVVRTHRGFGLEGGEVDVHVRAVHDGENAYFLFRWLDATRSQKHIPLLKTAQGWKLLHTNYYNNDENEFYEDKFAVMLARSPVAAGNTVRLGPKPLPDKPGPSNGLGLHAATDGSLADVWHWKSVRSGSLDQFDDNHFGAPLPAKTGRYTGGYAQDSKTGGGFEQNFEKVEDNDHVRLHWLPKNLAAQQARMGRFDPDPRVSDEGRFAMHTSEVLPYSAALDARIPVGTVIPSVVYGEPFSGDRGDVTVKAMWRDGWWTLEARRKLDTGSAYDQPIEDGMFMWVAVFDHNQVRHTRHVQPIRLQLQ